MESQDSSVTRGFHVTRYWSSQLVKPLKKAGQNARTVVTRMKTAIARIRVFEFTMFHSKT